MTNDLGSLIPEIEAAAKEKGLVLFHCRSRIEDDLTFIAWDTARRTDHREFLDAAAACGVKLICIHTYQFTSDELDDAVETLKESDLPATGRRVLEKQINSLRVYLGFTCGLELAFDYEGNVYFFHLRTPWRIEFMKLANEIDGFLFEDADDDANESLGGGGYFSRN